jgi:hypothetical protein
MVDSVCDGYVHSVSNAHLGLKRNNTNKQFPRITRIKHGHKIGYRYCPGSVPYRSSVMVQRSRALTFITVR